MTTVDHRSYHSVLIPWVIALVTLIGWNASFILDHTRVKKAFSSGKIELSQLVDDTKPSGRISTPQISLASQPTNETNLLGASSRLVLIEKRGDQSALRSSKGVIKSRAPPVGLVA